MLIEQAIFTSARTSRADGYQLVAASPGVTDDDARELAVWGPSHGSLCNEQDDASSVNFHRLEGGLFGVSKTVAAGEEYSGRGRRIYTQFFLVPSDVLSRFANNPFAVLRGAWAKGLVGVLNPIPEVLEAFPLVGRCATVDEGLVAQLADEFGPHRVSRLIASVQSPGNKLVAGATRLETLFGGLLNCLPMECRSEVSFTTGLRFSPTRPFRLGPLEDEQSPQRHLPRSDGVSVIDLSTQAETQAPRGWAAYLAELIAVDQLPLLASQLQQPRPGLQLEQLDALGDELLRELRRTTVAVGAESQNPRRTTKAGSANRPVTPSGDGPRDTDIGSARRPAPRPGSPPAIAPEYDPATADLLEQLDDAVYDAINTQPDAVEKVRQVWAQITARLTPASRSAVREQYLRYTLTLWEACLNQGLRDPQQALAALEVLALLFDTE